MSVGGRSYSDQSYGAHKTITLGGLSGATQTLGTNGVFSSHQVMYPCRVIGANVRVMSNGLAAATGITDLTQVTEIQLFRSTDTGTGLETVLGTADLLGATGTWVQTDAGSCVAFDSATETNFNAGDFIIFAVEGAWDDPINLFCNVEVYEKFVNSDT